MSILLSSIDELRLELVQLVLLLLTHRLTQGITLASGEVSQQTRQQHHLLLIDRNSVGVFQVFFHHRDVVFNRLPTQFSIDEIGNIIHRTWSIEGIHGNEVLKHVWLEFPQVFLHTRRFKLERSNGASVAIELISGRVFNIQAIYIHSNAQTVLDIFHGFFQDGQGFQSKEVHLDESRFLNHVSVILRTAQFFTRELLIIGSGNRYPITNIIPTNNRSASMHTRIANVVLQHLSIADGISQQRVGRSGSGF